MRIAADNRLVKARAISTLDIEDEVGLFGRRPILHLGAYVRVIETVLPEKILQRLDCLVLIRFDKWHSEPKLGRARELAAIGRLWDARDLHVSHEVCILSNEPQGDAAGSSLGIHRQIREAARRKKILYRIAQLPFMKLRARPERQPCLQLRARERLARRLKVDARNRQAFILKGFSNRILKRRARYYQQHQ